MNMNLDMDIKNHIQSSSFEKSAKSVIPLLQYVQEKFSYIPEMAIKEISDWTMVSQSHIYGVITFYSQFRLTPMGKNIIRVCDGTACHINNAEGIYEELSGILKIKDGETSKDGMWTLLTVACLGCCSLAPVIMINDKTYGRLNANQLKKIIDNYSKENIRSCDENEN